MEKELMRLLGKGLDKLKVLPPEFYLSNTLDVAKNLIGKILVVRDRASSRVTAGRIVETEAYRADDPASHCAKGSTPRCAVMFGPPGMAYVYLIYGMYEMLNFVTEPVGDPGAVLIRAIEPLEGIEWMQMRRGAHHQVYELGSGPGKVCRALGIRMDHSGVSLQGPELFVCEDLNFRISTPLMHSPRVGIRHAQEQRWRYFVCDHPCVSRVPQNRMAIGCEDR